MSTHSKVLSYLEENKGKCISGQNLAESIGVTRTSIWKAVQKLKEQGYEIHSTAASGYTLSSDSDKLNEEMIRNYLNEKNSELIIQVFQEIDSTNNQGKKQVSLGIQHDALILSECQTQGRGRRNKQFYSPCTNGLYMSLVLKKLPANIYPGILTLLTAVAVAKTIEKQTGCKPGIKWVNDLYLNHKKICGILTEATINLETSEVDSFVIGIGLNIVVEDEKVPFELKGIMGGILNKNESRKQISRNRLAAGIVNEIYTILAKDNLLFLDDYRKRCFVIGKNITFDLNGTKINGFAETVDEKGNLIVQTATEKMTFNYGEITLILGNKEENR